MSGYGYDEYSEMGFDDDGDDDCECDDYQYQDYGYDDEATWFYEWRGHFFYDKPTLKQKIQVTYNDFKAWFRWKFFKDDGIPF